MSLISTIQQAQFLAFRMRQASDAHIGSVVRDFVWKSNQLEGAVERGREMRSSSREVSPREDSGRVVDETA